MGSTTQHLYLRLISICHVLCCAVIYVINRSDSCKMDPHSKNTWGLCQAQQRPALVDFAASLHNGSMLSFNPCDLYKLIKGRTLWLVG